MELIWLEIRFGTVLKVYLCAKIVKTFLFLPDNVFCIWKRCMLYMVAYMYADLLGQQYHK